MWRCRECGDATHDPMAHHAWTGHISFDNLAIVVAPPAGVPEAERDG